MFPNFDTGEGTQPNFSDEQGSYPTQHQRIWERRPHYYQQHPNDEFRQPYEINTDISPPNESYSNESSNKYMSGGGFATEEDAHMEDLHTNSAPNGGNMTCLSTGDDQQFRGTENEEHVKKHGFWYTVGGNYICQITEKIFIECFDCHKALKGNKTGHEIYYMAEIPFCAKRGLNVHECEECRLNLDKYADIINKQRKYDEKEKYKAKRIAKKSEPDLKNWKDNSEKRRRIKRKRSNLDLTNSDDENNKQTKSSKKPNKLLCQKNRTMHETCKKLVSPENGQIALAISVLDGTTVVSGHYGLLLSVLESIMKYLNKLDEKGKYSKEQFHPTDKGDTIHSPSNPYTSKTIVHPGLHPVDAYEFSKDTLVQKIVAIIRGDALKQGKGKFSQS